MLPAAAPLLEALLAQSHDLVLLLDARFGTLERSISWTRVFGETRQFLDTVMPGSRARAAAALERKAGGGRAINLVHIDMRGKARRIAWHLVTAGDVHLLLGRDLAEDDRRLEKLVKLRNDSQRATGELRRFATTDPLTGVANRRAVLDAGRWVWSRTKVASVVLLDLDHFKRINDDYGHEAGDAMLQAVGASLQAAAGPGAVVGRWGGEEFAGIFMGDASANAQAMRDALRALRLDDGTLALRITGSVGVSVVPDTALVPLEDALAAADAAMYEAKAAGRDTVVVRTLLPRTREELTDDAGERRAQRRWTPRIEH